LSISWEIFRSTYPHARFAQDAKTPRNTTSFALRLCGLGVRNGLVELHDEPMFMLARSKQLFMAKHHHKTTLPICITITGL
jgi:hypothetical protein